MILTSPAFLPAASIPARYTCDGANINPPLSFSDVPSATKSLVLLMDDPDVPAAAPVRVWDHWVIFNIPPSIREIAEDSTPQGIVGTNTRGKRGYGGPCPPDREHRYFFKLFALDVMLDLTESATKSDVIAAMNGHILAQAELMGRYDRKR